MLMCNWLWVELWWATVQLVAAPGCTYQDGEGEEGRDVHQVEHEGRVGAVCGVMANTQVFVRAGDRHNSLPNAGMQHDTEAGCRGSAQA